MNVMLALISGLEPVAGLLFQWIDSDDAYSYKTTWFTIERDYINEDPILPLYRSEILEHIKLSSAYGKALDTHGLWFTRWPDGSFLYDVYNLSWSGAAIVTTPGNTSASSLPFKWVQHYAWGKLLGIFCNHLGALSHFQRASVRGLFPSSEKIPAGRLSKLIPLLVRSTCFTCLVIQEVSSTR